MAEFTLTDNPANTTASLLRSVCHADDSVILGSWLQETDHKAIEDQVGCGHSRFFFILVGHGKNIPLVVSYSRNYPFCSFVGFLFIALVAGKSVKLSTVKTSQVTGCSCVKFIVARSAHPYFHGFVVL